MRDRLQRRKKKPAESVDRPAPPPLQPAYFDAAEPPATPAAESETAAPADSATPPAREPKPEPQPEPRPRSRSRSAAVRSPKPPVEAPSEAVSSDSSNDASSQEAPTAPYRPAHAVDPAFPVEAAPRARGRRRRGGRGRGAGRGREQAVAQAFAPSAVKGTAPAVPPTEEFQPADSEISEPAAPAPQVPAETPVPKVPAAASVTQRAPKGIVVLAIGLPGSGKSTWFKRHNAVPLSSDMVRSLLFDDVREQRFQDLVFSNLRSMLKARLIAKRPMNYVDATNLTPQERQHWIKLAKDYNYEVHAVFFDVPLEVCIERHQRRDRVVPEEVMRRMAAKLKVPTFEEGFAKITVVRVKKKDDAAPPDEAML
ncbi:MAG TPA: AAA family ATPase [Candidatus Sulfotelmatobacter sp.]